MSVTIPELLDQAAQNQGLFGAVRKYDIHTGTDLYCPPGTVVRAIEGGEVTWKGDFTGPDAGSPWWNPTQAVMVSSAHHQVLYGEILVHPSLVMVDAEPISVVSGDILGFVQPVLKRDKGKPTSMLHLEVYDTWVDTPVEVWNHGQSQPLGLRDSTRFLRNEVVKNHPWWNLDERYECRKFRQGDVWVQKFVDDGLDYEVVSVFLDDKSPGLVLSLCEAYPSEMLLEGQPGEGWGVVDNLEEEGGNAVVVTTWTVKTEGKKGQ